MLTLQRRGIVDEYRQFSFSRASTAFDSRGRLYYPHNARFETVSGRTGVLVEESTMNLLSANQSSVETDTSGFSSVGAATLTRDTTTAWHGSASLKVSTPGSAVNEGVQTTTIPVTPSTPYTCSVYVKGDGSLRLYLNFYDGSNKWLGAGNILNFSPSGAWARYVVTSTSPANAAYARIVVETQGTAQATTFWVDGLQLEQKPYATSWTLGGTARSSETLTVPKAGILQPQAGTIELWVYVDAQVRDTSKIRALFSHFNGGGNANRITIRHNNTPEWLFTIADDAGNVHSLSVPDSYTPDGWHYFAMVWDSTRFAAFIDGVKRGEILNPSRLPQSLAPTFGIGCRAEMGADHVNTLIGPVRISNIARSDAEIIAAYSSGQPLQADQYTTLLLNFDGPDAQRAAKTVVI